MQHCPCDRYTVYHNCVQSQLLSVFPVHLSHSPLLTYQKTLSFLNPICSLSSMMKYYSDTPKPKAKTESHYILVEYCIGYSIYLHQWENSYSSYFFTSQLISNALNTQLYASNTVNFLSSKTILMKCCYILEIHVINCSSNRPIVLLHKNDREQNVYWEQVCSS